VVKTQNCHRTCCLWSVVCDILDDIAFNVYVHYNLVVIQLDLAVVVAGYCLKMLIVVCVCVSCIGSFTSKATLRTSVCLTNPSSTATPFRAWWPSSRQCNSSVSTSQTPRDRYIPVDSHYRAMHYSAKRGLAIACRLSVCLSVTLVDHQISWKPWKLIARTISPTSSLFIAQRSCTYSQGTWRNFGETRGVVGESGVLKHRSDNISEMR